jgi:cytochrome c oxidase cbb3-type subunit 4
MTYETVSRLAQQGGTVYFVILFVIGLAYALSPKRKDEFEHAARLPLDDEEG